MGELYYDVEFLDGTIEDLWLDVGRSFAFTTSYEANLASAALLDTVFIDSQLGLFDSNPSLTAGIGGSMGAMVYTPYAFDTTDIVSMSYAENVSESTPFVDSYGLTSLGINNSTDDRADRVLARWQPASSVPIPSALLLLASGCLSLAGISRCKKS